MFRVLRVSLCGLFVTAGLAVMPASASPTVEVQDAWVRVSKGSEPAQAFFVIVNHGDEDRLMDITSPASEKVQLSEMHWRGLDTKMVPVDSVKVPEISKTTLKPGGTSAVLVHLTEPLKVGQHIPLSLRFEHAGNVDVDAKVANQLLGNR